VYEIRIIGAFVLSLLVILLLSKKEIGVAIFTGAVLLGLITIPIKQLLSLTLNTFLNLNNLILAFAIGLIPIIGGLLSETGLLDKMVRNFPLGKRAFLMFSPAFLGLLTIPGGALFSAPLVNNGGQGLSNTRKASINVWFRHVLHIVYPLAPTLIIACELAGYSVYYLIPYLVPYFVLSMAIGFLYLLRKASNEDIMRYEHNLRDFLIPVFIILLAPIIDFLLRAVAGLKSLATLIGVTVALLVMVIYARIDLKTLSKVSKKMKPWSFAFLILAVLEYQAVFMNSGVSPLISKANLDPIVIIFIGFILGFLTGRTSTPIVILIPIFKGAYGIISPLYLSLMYYFILLGYIISPVHPCLIVTAQYFRISVGEVIKDLYKASLMALIGGFLISLPLL